MPKALSLQTFVSVARSDDPALKPAFTDLGDIDTIDLAPRPQYKMHTGPTLHGRRRKYAVAIGAELDIGFTLTELSGLVWEQLFLTAALNPTGNQSYTVLGLGQAWQGFVRFLQRDGAGTQCNTVDVYGVLTAEATTFGTDEVAVKFKLEVLESALATGSLTNLI